MKAQGTKGRVGTQWKVVGNNTATFFFQNHCLIWSKNKMKSILISYIQGQNNKGRYSPWGAHHPCFASSDLTSQKLEKYLLIQFWTLDPSTLYDDKQDIQTLHPVILVRCRCIAAYMFTMFIKSSLSVQKNIPRGIIFGTCSNPKWDKQTPHFVISESLDFNQITANDLIILCATKVK